jgi:hypothetical protein
LNDPSYVSAFNEDARWIIGGTLGGWEMKRTMLRKQGSCEAPYRKRRYVQGCARDTDHPLGFSDSGAIYCN